MAEKHHTAATTKLHTPPTPLLLATCCCLIATAATIATAVEGGAAIASQAAAASLEASKCSLELQGHYISPDIHHAALHCQGAPVVVKVNQTLLNSTNFEASGVVKLQDASLRSDNNTTVNNIMDLPSTCAALPGCVMTLCGGSPTVMLTANISGVCRGSRDKAGYISLALFCVANNSSLVVHDADMHGNTAGLLYVPPASSLTVLRSKFSLGDCMHLPNGSTAQLTSGITEDEFSMAEQRSASPFIVADAPAQVHIMHSVFIDTTDAETSSCTLDANSAYVMYTNDRDIGGIAQNGHVPYSMSESQFVVEHSVIANATCDGIQAIAPNSSIVLNNLSHSGQNLPRDANVDIRNGIYLGGFDSFISVYNTSISRTGPTGVSNAMHVTGKQIDINNCSFHNNSATGNPLAACVYIDQSDLPTYGTHVSVSDSVFADNFGMSSILIRTTTKHVVVTNTSMFNNGVMSTSHGSCIYHDPGQANGTAPYIIIKNCTCANNYAGSDRQDVSRNDVVYYLEQTRSSAGGAIYSSWGDVFVNDTMIINNTFGQSSYGGGVQIMNAEHAVVSNSSLIGNTAGIGGGAYIDSPGGVVTFDSCNITINTALSGGGSDIYASQTTQLSFTDSSIDIGSSSVAWWRTDCVLGEILFQGRCVQCGRFMYSLDTSNKTCDICPALGAECPGGDAIVPLGGFWHSTEHSVQLHKCPQLNENACLYNGTCGAGYTGNLCGVCEHGYGFNGSFSCSKCLSKVAHWVWFMSADLFALGIVAFTVHVTWQDNSVICDDGSASAEGMPRASDLMKMLIMFVQYLAIISSLAVAWPPSLAAVFTAAGWIFAAADSSTVSLDCLLNDSSNSIPKAAVRQLLHLLLPVCILVAVFVLIYVWHTFKHHVLYVIQQRARVDGSTAAHEHNERYTFQVLAKVPSACIIVAFFFYPFLVRAALSFFACYQLDSTTGHTYLQYSTANAVHGYWVSDMQQACFEGWHRSWALGLGIPCVVVFCIAVPAALMLGLWANRSNLHQASFRAQFGFLYCSYTPSKFWWEVVWTVQTCLLVAITVFRYTIGAYYAALLLTVVFGCSAALLLSFKPYSHRFLHNVQLTATVCLFFTSCVVLSFFALDVPSRNMYRQVIAAIAVSMILTFAVTLFVMVLVFYCMSLRVPKATIVRRMHAGAEHLSAAA